MKYINQINVVLVAVGVVAVGYALSETYFNPAAQPRVVLDLTAAAEAPETDPGERLGTPAPGPATGNAIVGVPNQPQRPTRSRTRPGNTLRENAPAQPPSANIQPGLRQGSGARPGGFNPQPANSAPPVQPGEEDEGDPYPAVEPTQRPARPFAPATSVRRPPPRSGFTPQGPPQGTPQQPPDKRENTPPPPARSSMPEG